MSFNGLTPEQIERLAILSEELGEAQQAIGKILRFGYDGNHPRGSLTNRGQLTIEMGDVVCALSLLCNAKDLDEDAVGTAAENKAGMVQEHMHFKQPE